jgi:micrococcal nuclease
VKAKALILVLIVSLAANFYMLFGKNINLPKSNNQTITKKVASVYDGDTFTTQDGMKIRLAGVDAPEEPDGCLALKAKERLIALIDKKEIKIELTGKKSFERDVGFVFVDEAFVDKIMLEEGFGKLINKKNIPYGITLSSAQDSAQKAKRGIWSELCQGNGCQIKGNYRKDNNTYIYHLPSCYNYDKIVVNEKERDQWFCTEKEALEAGFRKSEDCPKK